MEGRNGFRQRLKNWDMLKNPWDGRKDNHSYILTVSRNQGMEGMDAQVN